MGTAEDAVNAVRAAFEPGADDATKQKAASILRSLLSVLEATPGVPIGASGQPDILGALVEKFRAMLPEDAARGVHKLTIPLVAIQRR
jgi:hypothetical protein